MKKKVILRKRLLFLSVSIFLFWASHQNMDGYEATEPAKSHKLNSGRLSEEAYTFTQSEESFSNLFLKTMKNLNINCLESALINYQSQKLTSPNRQRSTTFEVTIQRSGNGKRMGKYCSSSGRQTLIRTMIVENAGKTFNLNTADLGYIRLYKSYFVINPISFSPDSRFLVARLDTVATITDHFKAYAIFDFENKYRYLKLAPCKDDQFGGLYHAFTSNTEVVFKCDISPNSYLEIINLQTLSIRRAAISSLKLPSHPVSFGSISQEFIVKP
jgi:hypothetical protein